MGTHECIQNYRTRTHEEVTEKSIADFHLYNDEKN